MEPDVIGSWIKERELGSGGFGVVSLWINHSTKECLAIKKCNRLCVSQLSQKQGDRWKLEVKNMEELDHENIVQFRRLPQILEMELSKYNPSGLPILSMEYCSMGNLRNALMKPQNCCGFSESGVIDILSDTSTALQYLHQKNITHRDFKPENIVLQPSASRMNGVTYKIIDLGYAKELDSATMSFVGTLQYLAPEIFQYQHYSNKVDYWSFGVTAFEVICGIRPFLPTFTPIAGFAYIKNKTLDVISIQITHTGDIDFSNKLLEENWLTSCLNTKLTKWLGTVLQYDPKNRGSVEGSVFDFLKTIISTKMITVFCIYTYEFYSYEVTPMTQYNTLLEKICNDMQLNRNDFYVVPTKSIKHVWAMDCYDEMNREAMLFIFRKCVSFKEDLRLTIPSIIKLVMENINEELNESALRQIYAQTMYFVLKEEKYLKKLKDSICFLSDFIKNKFEMKQKFFSEIKNILRCYLSEIEFYDKIKISIFEEICKTENNDKFDQLEMNYKHGIVQLNNIIKEVNGLLIKDKNASIEFDQIENLANDLIDHLGSYDYHNLKLDASKLLEIFYDDSKTQKNASPKTLKIILTTIKIRNKLMNDAPLTNFLSCASVYCENLNAFIAILNELHLKLNNVKEKLQKVVIDKLKIAKFNCKDSAIPENVEQLLNENGLLQIKIEKVLHAASSEITNVIYEVNNELDSIIKAEYSEMH